MDQIKTLIYKEWAEVRRNSMVLMTTILLPVLFLAIPLGMLVATRNTDFVNEQLDKAPAGFVNNPAFAGFNDLEMLQGALLSQFMLLFLMIPLAIPMAIATYSVVGEKTQRSLEPLLATPLSVNQLLLGKGLAASLPAVAVGWLTYILFAIGARFLVVSDRVYNLVLNPAWVMAMLVLVPLLTLLAVTVGIAVSSRVNDPRAAEQLGMMLILPVLGLFFLQIFGIAFAGILTFSVVALLALAADIFTLRLAVRLFQRETILTRWK